MSDHNLPKTWGRGRGSRLRLPSYPAGYAVLVTIGSYQRRPVFYHRELAEQVFTVFTEHERTDAIVLMPDHAHWLLSDSAKLVEVVQRAKSLATRSAWSVGYRGRLWQRSFFDTLIRGQRALDRQRRYVLANPVRSGLVETIKDYPWVYPKWSPM